MKIEVEGTGYKLTAEDRCDACNAQAYIHVTMEPGDLLFCLHHWKKHSDAIAPLAATILNESERLLDR
jgi:hypothetical protein